MFKNIIIFLSILLLSCSTEDKSSLKVGTISGPETELMEVAKKIAKEQYHLNIEIIEFSDYQQPNVALNEGSIDANMTQHQPFLEQQMKDHHYSFIVVGKTFVFPMGIYSKKIKNLNEIKEGATVAIPNDPSNEARALLLLQQAGLIKLQNNSGIYATPKEIADNPKKLHIEELDCAQLPRVLPDVDIAVINTNYAIPAGLSPSTDAIFHENKDSPYANVIVTRADEVNDPRIKELVKSVQSNAVLEKAKIIFKGQAIAAWVVNKS